MIYLDKMYYQHIKNLKIRCPLSLNQWKLISIMADIFK